MFETVCPGMPHHPDERKKTLSLCVLHAIIILSIFSTLIKGRISDFHQGGIRISDVSLDFLLRDSLPS